MIRRSLAAGLVGLLAAVGRGQAAPIGEILQVPVEQRFTADRQGLEGVAVQVGTYGRRNDCQLVLELLSATGRSLARREVDAARLVDLHLCALVVDGDHDAGRRDYVLRLWSPDARPGGAVTVFSDPADQGGGLTVGGAPHQGKLRLAMRFAGDRGAIGELVAGVRAVQHFTAPADGLAAVRVLLTDYARPNGGHLDAVLRDPAAGRELARVRTPCASIGNEHWLELRCPPVAGSGGAAFALELSSPDAVTGSAVTALLEPAASYRGELLRDGELQLGRLALLIDCEGGGLGSAAIARGLCGAATLLALLAAWRARRRGGPVRASVRLAAAGLAAWLAVEGHLRNVGLCFFGGGLGCGAALLAAGLAQTGRRRLVCAQFGLTALLTTAALAAFEAFGSAEPVAAATTASGAAGGDAAGGGLDLAARPWAFEVARGDPARFAAWWQRLTGEWHQQERGCGPLVEPDPLGELPFLVRPNRSSQFFDSTIATNSLGLRGPEVARAKGEAFRILCLGESTTMGQTLFATDVPWPERLQALLAARGGARPIEVLNAGFAGYDLRHSLVRLRRFLLDLQPDLVVVYHGYNGFWMLLPDVPPALVAGARVPQRPQRPSRLLAAFEYGLAVRAFERAQFGAVAVDPATVDVDASAAAAAYRELVALCTARGAKVALCSFNMAVARGTPPEVVAFYQQGFPQVGRQVAANELQTALLRRLCGDGSATFVDASRDLDGRYQDRFVDLVHFTQNGREQMANNVLAGIEALLP